MNTKPFIKLVKKAKRESPKLSSERPVIGDQNMWSRAVRSWVREFQQAGRRDSLPAFDRVVEINQRHS